MSSKVMISEALIHYIWRFRLYDALDLKTSTGESLYIENVGQYHQNAGPDFEFARIRIGQTYWSGHVEIHLRTIDWNYHGHTLDPAYNNVILHVVWEEGDKPVCRADGTVIPTLVLSPLVDHALLNRYEMLMNNRDWIPCASHLASVNTFTVQHALSRLVVERLAQKSLYIHGILAQHKQDWEKTLLILLGRSFGMKINADAFEVLCARLDNVWLHKNSSNGLQVESMLFGLAGFLEKPIDAYATKLKNEYDYLKRLLSLESMTPSAWRFMRMRPYNFPTYRIAQFAALLQKRTYLFMYFIGLPDLKSIFQFLDSLVLNPYWQNHFRFDVETTTHGTGFSKSFKNHLVINCLVPLLFAYGQYMQLDELKEKAINWLHELSPEINQITQNFAALAVKCISASDSQALLHLKQHYCAPKQCLSCMLGLSILKY